MKVHFMGSPGGDKDLYRRIIATLGHLGYDVVTHHILSRTQEQVAREQEREAAAYVKRSQSWVSEADVVIFEATRPTISLGFEIAFAVQSRKPTIVLYHEKRVDAPLTIGNYIKGLQSDDLRVEGYNDHNLDGILEDAIEFVTPGAKKVVNFLASREHLMYLDWIKLTRNTPRSVYLRTLIDQDMRNNHEYLGSRN